MIIQHNIGAINTARQFNTVNKKVKKSTEKLSSGYKVNRAADDAAGLSISEKMRNQIRGLNMAKNNSEDGISLLQTAEGALNEMHSIVKRISELSVKAANDVNAIEERESIQKEIDELVTELDKIANDTEFNGLKLLDGSFSASTGNISPFSNDRTLAMVETKVGGMEKYNGVIVSNPIIDSSATANIGTDKAQYLQNELVDSIIPQAVNSFLDTFTVFNDAASGGRVSDEIGLKLYSDSSTTLAYVACQYSYMADGTLLSDQIKLNLSVNTTTLQFDANGELTADSRTELETTIVHEMMHAFMDDTLTNGMIGAENGVLDSANEFPDWFVEGMAQSAAGGCANTNDWVNGGLGLDENSTDAEISSVLQDNSFNLSSGTTASEYGTGYLATMYLGYMAAGEPSTFTSNELADGLNTVLGKLMAGETMDDIINDISGGKYTDTTEFENGFGDSESTAFTSALLKAVGANGNGGVVDDLTSDDLLPDTDAASSVYQADVNNEFVASSVGGNRDWNTGGRGGSIGSNSGAGNSGPIGPGGGSGTKVFYLQVGASAGQHMALSLDDMHANILGMDNISVLDHASASDAIEVCENAVIKISDARAKIGAYVNRLEYTINNLENSSENTQASESRIRDTDMADEMVHYSMQNILLQAGQSMLTHATQNPENVLNLLQ